jgi:hypothetical protein
VASAEKKISPRIRINITGPENPDLQISEFRNIFPAENPKPSRCSHASRLSPGDERDEKIGISAADHILVWLLPLTSQGSLMVASRYSKKMESMFLEPW